MGLTPSVFLDWLSGQAPPRIHIISPHLDDAMLSVHALLASPFGPICQVTTIFTAAQARADPTWARVTGFTSAEQEFQARREEDRRAMSHLGISFRHAGGNPEHWDDAAAIQLSYELVPDAVLPTLSRQPLVLLPAAAGLPLSALRRLTRRVARVPTGSDAHPEHRLVRDRLFRALRSRGFERIAFYAEIPYSWTEAFDHLQRALESFCGRTLVSYRLSPRIEEKLKAVSEYRSQLVPILGVKRPYQVAVLSREECYLVMR